MMKSYVVAGIKWCCVVELEDTNYSNESQLHIEAATRAIEAKLNRRTDLEIIPYQDDATEEADDELVKTLSKLLNTEIKPQSGIGMLLCIADAIDPEEIDENDDTDHEWWLGTRIVLENASVPHLVTEYDKICQNQQNS